MTGGKANTLDRWCTDSGTSYVRFDYRGHGVSSGRFEDGTIGDWLGDSVAVVDRLTSGPQVLVGSSMGGWIALLLALARPERVRGLVLIAPAADFTEAFVWNQLDDARRQDLLEQGSIRMPSDYSSEGTILTKSLIEDGRRHLLLDAPVPLQVPLRILHGMQDTVVPWSHSLRLIDRVTAADVVLSLVKDGDHRLSREQDLARLCAAVEEVCVLAQGSPVAPRGNSDSAA
jgi:pimeloyl-ACP methyl ester carboxylesterase